MGQIPKSKSNREPAPEGTFQAGCTQVIDLGTQKTVFAGEEKEVRQIQLGFQLIGPKTKENKPFMVYNKYTYSTKSKNLLRDLKAWLGVKDLTTFDMNDCIKQFCNITILHNDAGYANITNIAGLPKGTKTNVKLLTEPILVLFLNPDEFDAGVFNELPEWLQGKIADSPEYLEASSGKKKSKPTTAPPAKKGKR